MKILASVLLAGFVMFGQQAIAKDDPAPEKIGNWIFSTHYDSSDGSIGYTLESSTDTGESALVAGCYSNLKIRLISFTSIQSLREKPFDEKDIVIAKVDNKENAPYIWQLVSMNGHTGLISSESEEFLKGLENGNKLVLGVLSKGGTPLHLAQFSLKGFDRSYQKFQSACSK